MNYFDKMHCKQCSIEVNRCAARNCIEANAYMCEECCIECPLCEDFISTNMLKSHSEHCWEKDIRTEILKEKEFTTYFFYEDSREDYNLPNGVRIYEPLGYGAVKIVIPNQKSKFVSSKIGCNNCYCYSCDCFLIEPSKQGCPAPEGHRTGYEELFCNECKTEVL